MNVTSQALAGLLLLAASASCRPSLGTSDPVILKLGERQVRKSAFDAHLARLAAMNGSALAPDVRRGLLQDFLEERVVALEARARGVIPEEASDEQEVQASHDLLSQAAADFTPVSDEETRRAFENHPESYRVEETVTLSQVLLPTDNQARDVRRLLQKDPRSFDQLARTRSRGSEASLGGRMGSFSRGQLPADLEAVAFRLPEGAFSEVVQTALGYHVLRCDARTAAKDPTFAEVQDRVRSELERARADAAARSFVRGLLSRAQVDYEAALAAPGDRR